MGVGNPSYFITTKNKKNMKNAIIVPFDLNTARMIKNGEIEGSVLIGNIEIEFVYESKNCSGPYNLLFVKKDESGISAIYADTEGRTFFNNDLELEVEAGAYFKKGDILISTLGNPFIYNGIINREGDMGCIYGISAYGEITSEEVPIWTSVCSEDKSKYVRLATIEERTKYEFKPFDKVLAKYYEDDNWEASLFIRTITDDQDGEIKYECLNGTVYVYCIPFEGNEYLLGTAENPEK